MSYAHQIVQVDLTQVVTEVRSVFFIVLSSSRLFLSFLKLTYLLFLCSPLPLYFLLFYRSVRSLDHQAGQRRHELEVEVRDVPQLLAEAQAFEEQDNNTYDMLLGVVLASVRMLIKNSS